MHITASIFFEFFTKTSFPQLPDRVTCTCVVRQTTPPRFVGLTLAGFLPGGEVAR